MRDADAMDAMIERLAREEQDDLDRARGQHILDLAAGSKREDDEQLLRAIGQAYSAREREREK